MPVQSLGWEDLLTFSSCPQSLPASESFPMSQLLLLLKFPKFMYHCTTSGYTDFFFFFFFGNQGELIVT